MKHENEHSEKWPQDSTGRIFLGIIIIWLGISFLLKTYHVIYSGDWWIYFIIGLGAILIAESIVRIFRSGNQQANTGKLIGGCVLIAIGLAGLFDIEDWWPLILVVVGIVVLVGGIKKNKEV